MKGQRRVRDNIFGKINTKYTISRYLWNNKWENNSHYHLI